MAAPQLDRWDIVHTRSPHAQAGSSPHWALIVGDPYCNSHGDYVVIQITSTAFHGPTDFILRDSDPEFAQTGLNNTSTFRCHKLFPVSASAVFQKKGAIGPQTMVQIESHLKRVFAW